MLRQKVFDQIPAILSPKTINKEQGDGGEYGSDEGSVVLGFGEVSLLGLAGDEVLSSSL